MKKTEWLKNVSNMSLIINRLSKHNKVKGDANWFLNLLTIKNRAKNFNSISSFPCHFKSENMVSFFYYFLLKIYVPLIFITNIHGEIFTMTYQRSLVVAFIARPTFCFLGQIHLSGCFLSNIFLWFHFVFASSHN